MNKVDVIIKISIAILVLYFSTMILLHIMSFSGYDYVTTAEVILTNNEWGHWLFF